MKARIAALRWPQGIFWGSGGEPPPLGASVNNVLAYSIRECASIVNGRGRFYIGVTMDPFWRFFGDADWKHHHNWKWMHILAVSTAPGIKRLERLILANPRVGLAQYFNTNVGEGGEGVSDDAPANAPYFLYVVVDATRV